MKTILCYGDSNTFGFSPETGTRYPRDVRWTGKLQELLGSDYYVIEEGCPGRTTVFDDPDDEWVNGKTQLIPCLKSHMPLDIVVLMLGTNDLKAAFQASAGQIADGAGQLVKIIQDFPAPLQGYSPKVVLISPPVIGNNLKQSFFYGMFQEDAIERSRQFSACYKRVAEQFGCEFLDAAEWVLSSDADAIHLNAGAHSILAEKVKELVLRL